MAIPAYEPGAMAFLLVSTGGVFLMVPGLGFLYSGLARRKSALSMIWMCLMAGAMSMFTWYFWGYSLAFSKTASNGFIGNLHHFALRHCLEDAEDAKYPELLFAAYQGMFCAVTNAIIVGAAAERARLFPFMIFVFAWTTIVYAPLAYWAWGGDGWAGARWGVMDYAGGGPVEIGAGVGGLAYAMVVGRRKETLLLNFRPHNVSMVTLGTIMLWFGWLFFNAGSAFGANLRAVYALWNSNLTAVFGAFFWCLLDWRLERKWSTVAICSGMISGLVAATPASGYIPLWASVILGAVSGVLCNFSTQIKYLLRIDDSMDTFAEHGVAGIIGLIFNALFGSDWIVELDGITESATTGWLSHHYAALYKQVVYTLACCGYAFVVTALLAYIINYIPGCKLRVSEEGEARGIDEDQIGEFAYDYVEVRRDYLSWAPAAADYDHHPHPQASASPPASQDSTEAHLKAQ